MIRKTFLPLLIAFILLVLTVSPCRANNQFGIHILETTELEKAGQLVNSNGGDWGYVTVVIREDDLKLDKWQKFFDDCRRFHLIPIVRIATEMLPAGVWAKPNFEELQKWPEFLNRLNWPVKQQIITIYNEPNHAEEWGGKINPQEYALVLEKLIALFKATNSNFFILNAGLDQAADGRNGTITESRFLTEMTQAVPNIINQLDGWSSHSYPNHGFVGLPENTGKASIRGYEWELTTLKRLGLKKELPVYLTETGWPHSEGLNNQKGLYDSQKVAHFLTEAFSIWGKDPKIKAITPFVLNSPQPPFDHFSWLKTDSRPYPQYEQIANLPKTKSEPEQIETYEIIEVHLLELLPTNHLYHGKISLKNTGQWIMGERKGFSLSVEQSDPALAISEIKLPPGKFVFPGEKLTLDFSLNTGTQSGEHQLKLAGREFSLYIFKPFELTNRHFSLWRQILVQLRLWLNL